MFPLGPVKRKRSVTCQPKASKVYTKDVVCLLPIEDMTDIRIPRGGKRAQLAEMGLIGKVSINSAWKAGEVIREICSVFSKVFNLPEGEILSFDFLRYGTCWINFNFFKIHNKFIFNRHCTEAVLLHLCLIFFFIKYYNG